MCVRKIDREGESESESESESEREREREREREFKLYYIRSDLSLGPRNKTGIEYSALLYAASTVPLTVLIILICVEH